MSAFNGHRRSAQKFDRLQAVSLRPRSRTEVPRMARRTGPSLCSCWGISTTQRHPCEAPWNRHLGSLPWRPSALPRSSPQPPQPERQRLHYPGFPRRRALAARRPHPPACCTFGIRSAPLLRRSDADGIEQTDAWKRSGRFSQRLCRGSRESTSPAAKPCTWSTWGSWPIPRAKSRPRPTSSTARRLGPVPRSPLRSLQPPRCDRGDLTAIAPNPSPAFQLPAMVATTVRQRGKALW